MWKSLVNLTLHRIAWIPAVVSLALLSNGGPQSGTQLAHVFARQVDRKLEMPEAEQHRYAEMLRTAFADAGLRELPPQFVILVDKSVFVQAVMIFWISSEHEFVFIGASPASTGKPGSYEHFETPLGVFPHTTANPDFRAEGTRNEFGILGYGRKGMRVFDFGWVKAPKGWGDYAESVMRLQMHATDPGLLEPKLGTAQSKGCIRVPATFDRFVDHYGILDADYERAAAGGKRFFVLISEREPTSWSGEYLVVIDSGRLERPVWSPLSRR